MRIALDSVRKSFGSLRALDKVTLDVEPGRILAVLGTNGAGKTTLLRLLAGLLSPDHGMILYDGQVFRRDRLDLRRRFLFLPDFPELFPGGTLCRHLGLCLRLYQVERDGIEDRVVELLRDYDLLPLYDAPVAMLSRGQAYKAGLVTLMAVDPEVWLLDEPFASGMDAHAISAFKTHVRDASRRGRTVLYTTQILDVAERLSDDVCILHKGQVHAFDSVARLSAQSGGRGGVLEALFRALREEPGSGVP